MKVLITCVCYNNFSDALGYISSLSEALLVTSNVEKLDLYLVNNGTVFTAEQISSISTTNLFNVFIVENKINNGYFPGCLAGYKASLQTNKDYDAMLVSNVDLEVAGDFFNQLDLLNSSYQQSPVIVAPSIISIAEKKDRNPKIRSRFTKKQMLKYLCLYAVPYLHSFYKKTFYKKKQSKLDIVNGTEIYAPHGSFIIFLSGVEFWKNFLEYPVFLFGEEIYIGEQARHYNIPVHYHNELKVIDSDHASTGKENERFIRKHNFKAISYLFNRYWKV